MRLTARSDLTEPSRLDDARGRRRRSGSRAMARSRRDPRPRPRPPWPRARRIRASRRALLDRQRAARSVLGLAEDGEEARLHLVENLDHAAGIGRLFPGRVGIELDAHQDARAQAWRGGVVTPGARPPNQDPRRAGHPRSTRRAWRPVRRRGRARRCRRRQARAGAPARSAPCGRAQRRPRPASP